MSLMPMNQGDYGQPVMQDISRQRRLADQLRQQSSHELQGQMIGATYVPPSWTQHLARVLQGYGANKIEGDARKQEGEYNANKSRKLADILAGNKSQQVQDGVTTTSTMPAYEPSQMDRFGSPMAERQPQITNTPNMRQESPQEQMQRVQPQVLEYMAQYGNTPEAQYLLGQLNKQDDRAYAKGEKMDDRQYTDTREEKLYNRGRQDKLSDIDAERKYQDIVRADQQGFQVSQQDRQFEQQYKLQNLSQNFAANQQSRSQTFQASENQKNRDNQLQVATGKAKATPLSAAAQKEVFEADETVQSSKNAVGMLEEAKNLNSKAYSGFGAKTRATIRSNLPGESESANATVNLDNLMTGQALESLKATFGGMPTEGERKILLDMQASADKTPAQRQAILDRAIAAANRRIEFNQQKSDSLRSGDYFSPQPKKTETAPSKIRTVDW